MKVILLASFPVSLSVFDQLSKNNHLHAVCFEELALHNSNQDYLNLIQKEGIPTYIVNKENISKEFKNWLQDQSPDLVLVCGFSSKIPKELLDIPTYGFLNIHFGSLPENRGPDPLFRSIKKGLKQTAISIHQMDEGWDNGKVLINEPVPLMIGETLGMVNSKMSYMLGELTGKAIDLVQDDKNFTVQSTNDSSYNKRPTLLETSIDWKNQTSDEIESLVNACNPKYGGATTYYQGAPIKILEVSPVDPQTPLSNKAPGEIVHAHPQEGLFVSCKQGKIIRVNTISSDAGILSGTKYVQLGIQIGHCFTTNLSNK